MANGKIEFFPDEMDAVMALLFLAEELFELKPTKAPESAHENGKMHLYFETRDHKKRTKASGKP